MKRWMIALAATMAGCGGGEDFALEIAESPAAVYASLRELNYSVEERMFEDLQIRTTRPRDNQIVYTVPADDGEETTIALTLEPIQGGRATRVHAAVDMPLIRIEDREIVLSEWLIENELARVLAGNSRRDGTRSLLLGLAIASNERHMDTMMLAETNPAAMDEIVRLAAAQDRGSTNLSGVGAMSDPDSDARRAIAPQDDARGAKIDVFDPTPDSGYGEPTDPGMD